MTAPDQILALISSADPADAATLNEIDARVWCWLNGARMVELPPHSDTWHFRYIPKGEPDPANPLSGWCGTVGIEAGRYTRSRDALKQIRPEGWIFSVAEFKGQGWTASLENDAEFDTYYEDKNEDFYKTEELAELHAIIQAIAHDRRTAQAGGGE